MHMPECPGKFYGRGGHGNNEPGENGSECPSRRCGLPDAVPQEMELYELGRKSPQSGAVV